MISRVSGILREIKELVVVVDVGGICYDIKVSGWTVEKLKNQDTLEKPIEFFTFHYIEGNVAIGNLTPRLVGFLQETDQEFFEVFTTVKGLGVRKALRAMIHPVQEIAMAIETGNTAFLRQLPEIGPRTADRIIAEIKGKMAHFTQLPGGESPIMPAEEEAISSFKEEAKDVLLQLGYKKNEVERMIQSALAHTPHIKEADELVQAVFRQRPA